MSGGYKRAMVGIDGKVAFDRRVVAETHYDSSYGHGQINDRKVYSTDHFVISECARRASGFLR